jgi:hypothetical protein
MVDWAGNCTTSALTETNQGRRAIVTHSIVITLSESLSIHIFIHGIMVSARTGNRLTLSIICTSAKHILIMLARSRS